MMVAGKALIQVEKNIEKASAYQAAGIYGLLRTHERLDAGEATENVAVNIGAKAETIDALAALLHHSLTQPQSNRDPAADAIIIHPLIAQAGKKRNGGGDGNVVKVPRRMDRSHQATATSQDLLTCDEKKEL